MTSWKLPVLVATWITRIAAYLDPRQRPVFVSMCVGILLNTRRSRTATNWFRAGKITTGFHSGYRSIRAVGRKAPVIANQVLVEVENSPACAGSDRLCFALDDTPSPRYGPHVEGAGIHHNPTPGPANQAFVYGHNWVTLARLAHHPKFGTTALPLRAELYVRKKDVPKIPVLPGKTPWKFRTKLEMAAQMMDWLGVWLKHRAKPIWLAVDGAYAKRQVLQAASRNGITLVSRLRRDAALKTLPKTPPAGKRGRKPKYGKQKISLSRRAAHKLGWETEVLQLYGKEQKVTYKSFLATWPVSGGVIRVVIVKNEDGTWVAFFCTDPNATVAEILGMVADRNALEQTFKCVKEDWGAGEQQLRKLDANIGAWHLNLWSYTMVELWSWELPASDLVNRQASPWDDASRRPSHADRRKSLRREILQEEIRAAVASDDPKGELLALTQRLLDMAA